MAEVLFYHLTRSPLEVTLPELLEKSRARGWKVLVRTGASERLGWLDERLWLGPDTGFLPHGLAGEPNSEEQPILLTDSKGASNGADILMLVDSAELDPGEVADFERVCVLFDGNDAAALASARTQWKDIVGAGCQAKYFAQEPTGWVQKQTSGAEVSG